MPSDWTYTTYHTMKKGPSRNTNLISCRWTCGIVLWYITALSHRFSYGIGMLLLFWCTILYSLQCSRECWLGIITGRSIAVFTTHCFKQWWQIIILAAVIRHEKRDSVLGLGKIREQSGSPAFLRCIARGGTWYLSTSFILPLTTKNYITFLWTIKVILHHLQTPNQTQKVNEEWCRSWYTFSLVCMWCRSCDATFKGSLRF